MHVHASPARLQRRAGNRRAALPALRHTSHFHDRESRKEQGKLMERQVTRGPAYIMYTYPEKEFKEKLGIKDPEPVLTVERHVRTGEFIVRLRRED